MAKRALNTFAEVFEALGKNKGLEELTDSKPSAVSMWKKAGVFPSNTYAMMTDALRDAGMTAPRSLWKQKGQSNSRRRHAA